VAAAHTLKASFTYFPEGTIHVAVVDPGVGTRRAIIAAQCDGHRFVAPDNGLLAPILHNGAQVSVYDVKNEKLYQQPVSRTFHGRDIIAPVAGHLSMGHPIQSVGPAVTLDRIAPLEATNPRLISPDEVEGRIIAVDRFGNLITNLDADIVNRLKGEHLSVIVGDHTIHGLAQNYAQCDSNAPLAIWGSRNCIEIAVNRSSAAQALQMTKGNIVRVRSTT